MPKEKSLQQTALTHEQALKNHSNLTYDALRQLQPLSHYQSTPPDQDGKTLPYLLLLRHNIKGFVLLINQKNYPVHLPQFGKYNPLKLLLQRDDADVILMQIEQSLLPDADAYYFIVQEILTPSSNSHKAYDAILNWLFQDNKLSKQRLTTLFSAQSVPQLRKLVQSLHNEQAINHILPIVFSVVPNKEHCAYILEPIVSHAATGPYRQKLLKLAELTYSSRFEFTQQLLSSLPEIIDSSALRQKFLIQLLATTPATPLPILKKWYIKNRRSYAEDFLQDMTAIQQRSMALKHLRSFTTPYSCMPFSEEFLWDLVHPTTPMNSKGEPDSDAIHTLLNILHPTLSTSSLSHLKHLILSALEDETSRALILFDWFLTREKPFFDTETDTELFINQNASLRRYILNRIFEVYQDDHEHIKIYLLQCYGSKPFDLQTMHKDLQALQKPQWTLRIIQYLAENQSSEMVMSAELFLIIDPLQLGRLSDLVTKFAHLKNKTAIRTFLDSAPTSIEYKISLICGFPEVFDAENYYNVFKNHIVPTVVLDQYRYIESYLRTQEGFEEKDGNTPFNNHDLKQPSAPLEESIATVECIVIQNDNVYLLEDSSIYARAEPISESALNAPQKELSPAAHAQQEVSSSSAPPQRQSEIAQKILLAFVRVAFYEISSSNIMELSRQLKDEWLASHFLPLYIQVMHKWAQILILLHHKGKENVSLENEISAFMEEPALPNETPSYTSWLKSIGFFPSKENQIYCNLIHQKHDKNVMESVKTPELNSEYLMIDQQFKEILRGSGPS